VILVDTSLWVAHLRSGHATLAGLLERGLVLGHPWVVGELALGDLRRRLEILALLSRLPQATVATAPELLTLIEAAELAGTGLGYVDVQLLASTRLSADARLWTEDRRLAAAATRLGHAFDPAAER
jgi:predicted nucleic acid-binding protein